MPNATYLFEKPDRASFRNSESRWTAVAQLALFWLSKEAKSGTVARLPVYRADAEGYLTVVGDLPVSGFDHTNTVCEQSLNKGTFEAQDIPNELLGLKPDIINRDLSARRACFIEVKTIGESVSRNIDRYEQLVKWLGGDARWQCELYYLLSHGHETYSDWPLLAGRNSKILLWEDLFTSLLDAGPDLANMLSDDLGKYCDRPLIK